MAVGAITDSNSILLAALGRRQGILLRWPLLRTAEINANPSSGTPNSSFKVAAQNFHPVAAFLQNPTLGPLSAAPILNIAQSNASKVAPLRAGGVADRAIAPPGTPPAANVPFPTPAVLAAQGTTANLNIAQAIVPQTTIAPQIATSAAPAEVAIPVTATFLTLGLSPATFPLTLFPDRTPYVLVVYQPNDPAPLPGKPAPIDREVPPTTPAPETLPVGDSRLRRLLLHGRGARTGQVDYYSTRATRGQAEKSIRYTLGQVNAEMAARGLPLHLVFARQGDDFAVDVYDCSFSEACRLSYDIPIPLDRLSDVLGNLQHETGIIVDTTS